MVLVIFAWCIQKTVPLGARRFDIYQMRGVIIKNLKRLSPNIKCQTDVEASSRSAVASPS